MKKLMMFAAVCSALAASAAITITDVSARQRWPWNGLVDVDFTIAGAAAGEAFAIDIDATADKGGSSHERSGGAMMRRAEVGRILARERRGDK